ncbi:hypothetical protein JOF55_000012 [Haloactinomyces albus]|uniref:Resolvase/invertase-type recombinase catalytic domain-containing protein n=1 Tax=Haloactinomyces albus TaxID=1352928 RepID=A0AAE4CK21_9ACTN|nr:hypothetical protein [Haloactinomyces albus]
MPDARAIGDDLAERGIALSLGGQVYDLATFAEFEVDLLRMRTREGMAVAKARGPPTSHSFTAQDSFRSPGPCGRAG